MKKVYKLISIILILTLCQNVKAYTITDYFSAMNQHDYSKAVDVMSSIIKSSTTKNGDIYYKRACAYEKKGNYVDAAIDCGTALKYSPGNQEYYLLKAKCKQKIGDPTYIEDAKNAGNQGLALIEHIAPESTLLSNQPATISTTKPSNVDINIPSSFSANEKTFVLIFNIENYIEKDISNVDYAINDGSKVKEYCTKTLGIPEYNIHIRTDATRNQMRSEIKWIKNISDAYGNDANFILYYSGHGMPDEKSRKAYLLPSDGIANDPESGYSLAQLYEELGELKFSSTLVLLDACFSGTKRNGEMLTASKGIVIKPSQEELTGNVVVISATQGDDTAYPDDANRHGLFTYFLLKKLQETKGNVTIGDLADYITQNVKRTSVVKMSKMQTPTVNYSEESTVNLKNVNLLKK